MTRRTSSAATAKQQQSTSSLKWMLTLLTLSIQLKHTSQTIIVHPSAISVSCPTEINKPTKIDSIPKLNSLDGSDIDTAQDNYLLLSLTGSSTNSNEELCTLTRVDTEGNGVYTPISRSYNGHEWQRVPGKYVQSVNVTCGAIIATSNDGDSNEETKCQIQIPPLTTNNDGYYLTTFQPLKPTSSQTLAAKFLERTTFGATWEQIVDLEQQIDNEGEYALAKWVHSQINMEATSHRKFFRENLNPRTVESYQYGIPSQKVCEALSRYRRFAITYKDVELSRGAVVSAGSTGLPYTPLVLETRTINGQTYRVIKFGDHIRTIITQPLKYKDGSNQDGPLKTLQDGSYTICNAEETVGKKLGNNNYIWSFQLYVNGQERCTSSFTNRGGVQDFKGDGTFESEKKVVNGRPLIFYDSDECNAKCSDKKFVKYITLGNPEVNLPPELDLTPQGFNISYIDMSSEPLDIFTVLNENITNTSSYILNKPYNDGICNIDANGITIPDPAQMSNTDYYSYGKGKYNLDKPTFVKMPNGEWAIHDLRTLFYDNTVDDPKMDGGGTAMKRAARDDDGDPTTGLVTRCLNTQRNWLNEPNCKISYDENACVSTPLPDPATDYTVFTRDPGAGIAEPTYKYEPKFAGPNQGGVVMCGSPDEVAPNPYNDDTFDVMNRKVQSNRIDYDSQKRGAWVEVVLNAPDQLCQRNGWNFHKIFATSNDMNSDPANTESNLHVLDTFTRNCFATFRDVMFEASLLEEMATQLTYLGNKAMHSDWHQYGILAPPDENMARENLQLHSLGLTQMDEYGVPILDERGELIDNYEQKNIYSNAKIWTGMTASIRRANNEEQDWSPLSRVDPLVMEQVRMKDWGPKINLFKGHLGDLHPQCVDLPEKHFLKKNARYRLLGGSTLPLSQDDPNRSEGDPEVNRMKLDSDSELYNKLCNPKPNPPPLPDVLVAGTGEAEETESFTAPYCKGRSNECKSKAILQGGRDANDSNTIDECKDGSNTQGSLYGEKMKKISVKSVNPLADLRGGELVKIEADIEAFSTCDRVTYYFTTDANEPKWHYLTTVAPPKDITTGLTTTNSRNDGEIRFNLPPCTKADGCQQAVRVVLRSGRNLDSPNSPTCVSRMEGVHKPDTMCNEKYVFDDADDLVFDVQPNSRPQDECDFQTIVTLDENLSCTDQECEVDTIRVVEVTTGVYYEYLHMPCIFLPVYDKPVKVFSGYNTGNKGLVATMCADRRWTSAMSVCCGYNDDRDPKGKFYEDYGEPILEYSFERITFQTNRNRCPQMGRNYKECDPKRIGDNRGNSGHCLDRQNCKDVIGGVTTLETYNYHWTPSNCKIKVKIITNGMVAIIHEPDNKWPIFNSNDGEPDPQSHVNKDKTVSYFYVWWDESGVSPGSLPFPHYTNNNCNGGDTQEDTEGIQGFSCICKTTLEETAVFTEVPTRDEVLSTLKIGAFDPTMYDNGEYIKLDTNEPDVVVYKKNGSEDYSLDTVFQVLDHKAEVIFLKNVQSIVSVCDGKFSFRNPPTFFDTVDPEVLSGEHEFDALMDHVDSHPVTPPSTCHKMLKYYGFSNPTLQHVKSCVDSFKSGTFVYETPGKDTLTYGDGRRGHLGACTAAIFLNKDAIFPVAELDPASGGVQSPLLKFMKLMKSMGLTRTLHNKRTDGLFSEYWQDAFGESPYGNPDAFSFYQLDYYPAGVHRIAELVAPEAELLTMNYIVPSHNAVNALIGNGLNACDGGVGPYFYRGTYNVCGNSLKNAGGKLTDTAAYLSYVPDDLDLTVAEDVIDRLATLLTSDRLHPSNRAKIKTAYQNVLNEGGDTSTALKVAVVLLTSTAEYHTVNTVEFTGNKREPAPPDKKDETVSYKAIVSVNLFGGMDSYSMLVPWPDGCKDLYDEYKKYRTKLTLKAGDMDEIDPQTDQPCNSFGVNNHLTDLTKLYNRGDVVFFASIGHLNKRVDRTNFLTETTTQLFSHHTMREESFKVDAFDSFAGTGVLGRLNDEISKEGLAAAQISIDKNLNIIIGDATLNRPVDIIPRFDPKKFYPNSMAGGTATSEADNLVRIMKEMNEQNYNHSSIHANLWSQTFLDSQERSEEYLEILEGVGRSNLINKRTRLGQQLDMTYRMIKAAATGQRSVNRDVIALEMGGFDQHFSGLPELHALFDEINDALYGFQRALNKEGLWDNVTLVLHSEFARTFTINGGGGTDHAWGGNHMVMGGSIRGKRVLGRYLDKYDPLSKYVTGRGVAIPTLPLEAQWHPILQWFGIRDNEAMKRILPNLGNFGCDIYSEKDLYINGTGGLYGCGGDIVELNQVFEIQQARELTAQEQKDFCFVVTESLLPMQTLCVIAQQIISTPTDAADTDYPYMLDVSYTISSDRNDVKDTIIDTVNTEDFQIKAVSILQMNARLQPAEVPPSPSPTQSPLPPGMTRAPSESPTSSPTRSTTSPPSSSPSTSPSKEPTVSPSKDPSIAPSKAPVVGTPDPTTSPMPTVGVGTPPTQTPPSTAAPTTSPVKVVASLEADVDLQLNGLTYEDMNEDEEAVTVFESECASYLDLSIDKSFDGIDCTLTLPSAGQRRRRRRSLQDTTPPPLKVDLLVSAISISENGDTFIDLVHAAFEIDRAQELREMLIEKKPEIFVKLSSIELNPPENDDDTSSSTTSTVLPYMPKSSKRRPKAGKNTKAMTTISSTTSSTIIPLSTKSSKSFKSSKSSKRHRVRQHHKPTLPDNPNEKEER